MNSCCLASPFCEKKKHTGELEPAAAGNARRALSSHSLPPTRPPLHSPQFPALSGARNARHTKWLSWSARGAAMAQRCACGRVVVCGCGVFKSLSLFVHQEAREALPSSKCWPRVKNTRGRPAFCHGPRGCSPTRAVPGRRRDAPPVHTPRRLDANRPQRGGSMTNSPSQQRSSQPFRPPQGPQVLDYAARALSPPRYAKRRASVERRRSRRRTAHDVHGTRRGRGGLGPRRRGTTAPGRGPARYGARQRRRRQQLLVRPVLEPAARAMAPPGRRCAAAVRRHIVSCIGPRVARGPAGTGMQAGWRLGRRLA